MLFRSEKPFDPPTENEALFFFHFEARGSVEVAFGFIDEPLFGKIRQLDLRRSKRSIIMNLILVEQVSILEFNVWKIKSRVSLDLPSRMWPSEFNMLHRASNESSSEIKLLERLNKPFAQNKGTFAFKRDLS